MRRLADDELAPPCFERGAGVAAKGGAVDFQARTGVEHGVRAVDAGAPAGADGAVGTDVEQEVVGVAQVGRQGNPVVGQGQVGPDLFAVAADGAVGVGELQVRAVFGRYRVGRRRQAVEAIGAGSVGDFACLIDHAILAAQRHLDPGRRRGAARTVDVAHDRTGRRQHQHQLGGGAIARHGGAAFDGERAIVRVRGSYL